jgi:cobalamin biosynthesis protein CobT
MLGLELTSETMLCLGIMFILSGVLFFYMKKQITHLEDAQMEQAKLLQHIIANISTMPSNMGANMGANIGANMGADIGAPMSENKEEYHRGNLIDVSDGEQDNSDSEEEDDDSESEGEGSSESEDDSDDELENDEENEVMEEVNIDKNTLREFSALPVQEVDLNAIDEDSMVEIPDTVKVVNMNTGASEHEPEEVELDVESLTSTNLDDDDTLTINSSISGTNLAKTSLKALKVGDLRKMVIERGLHSDPSKVKKAELITLLQQH